jgi:hypothetical protein
MPPFDIETADALALAKEQRECSKRMDRLRAEFRGEEDLLKRIGTRLDHIFQGYVRPHLPEVDGAFKEIESRMLKAASRIITDGRKARKPELNVKDDALSQARDIAAKHGLRDVTPRVAQMIDAKVKKVYAVRNR